MPFQIDQLKKDALVEDAERKDFALKEEFRKKEAARKKQQQEVKDKISQERTNQDLYMDEGNEKGEKQTYWQYVSSKAAQFTKFTGQQSYVQFSTCIMDLFGMYVAFSKHVSKSKLNAVSQLWKYSKKGASWAWDKVKGKAFPELSTVDYGFHIDENGLLETKLLRDGETLDENEKREFDTFFIAWLETHGIECDAEGRLTRDGEPVSKGMIETLDTENDGAHSFSNFLRQRAEINARYQPAPDLPEPEGLPGLGL